MCPEGSYSLDGQCVPCPVGFYQEEAGSVACVPCPAGRTTAAIGAFSQRHCKSHRDSVKGKPVHQVTVGELCNLALQMFGDFFVCGTILTIMGC